MKIDKINFNTKTQKNNLMTTSIAPKISPTMQTIDIDYKKSSQAIRNNFMQSFKGQMVSRCASMYNSPTYTYCADAGEDVDPKEIELMSKKEGHYIGIQYDKEPCLGLNDIRGKASISRSFHYFQFAKDAIHESEYLDRLEHFANQRLGDSQYFLNENKEKLDRSLQSLETQKAALELKPWEDKRKKDLEIAQYFVNENQEKYDKAKEKNDRYQSQINYAQSQRPLAAKRYNVLSEFDKKREDRTIFDQKIDENEKRITYLTSNIDDFNKEIDKKEQAIKLHKKELKDTDVEIYHKRVLRISKQAIEEAQNKIAQLQNEISGYEKENEHIKQNILPYKEKAVDEAFEKVENFYKEFYPKHCN